MLDGATFGIYAILATGFGIPNGAKGPATTRKYCGDRVSPLKWEQRKRNHCELYRAATASIGEGRDLREGDLYGAPRQLENSARCELAVEEAVIERLLGLDDPNSANAHPLIVREFF
jgi:hypothetical protein